MAAASGGRRCRLQVVERRSGEEQVGKSLWQVSDERWQLQVEVGVQVAGGAQKRRRSRWGRAGCRYQL